MDEARKARNAAQLRERSYTLCENLGGKFLDGRVNDKFASRCARIAMF